MWRHRQLAEVYQWTNISLHTDRQVDRGCCHDGAPHSPLSPGPEPHLCEDAICRFLLYVQGIPQKLVMKLSNLGLGSWLFAWVLDFLRNRPQCVRLGDNTSSTLTLSTGTPQGCVFSPLLFSLFTHDCSPIHPTNTIIKFADDTTMVGWLGTIMSHPTGTDLFSIKKNSSFWWSKPMLQCVHQAFERWLAKTHTPLTG